METIGILGIGQMGAAAAVAFQRAGYRVLLWARDSAKLTAVQSKLDQLKEWSFQHVGPAKRSGGEIIMEASLERLDAETDAILECILEVMDEKAALLSRLKGCRERNALIMSATSGLSITEMGRRGGCEQWLVGAHFWNPPHLIPLVEMIGGAKTPAEMLDRACSLVADIGKIPVRCKDVPGFIGNRLLHALWREALALVDADVCSAEDVDKVIKLTFALRLPALGPMENMDLVGLDAVERIHKYLLPELAANTRPSLTLTEKVLMGELGMKSGKGFYEWSPGGIEKALENRDRQIVRQLEFLREIGGLD